MAVTGAVTVAVAVAVAVAVRRERSGRYPCVKGWLAISVITFAHDRHAVVALFGTAELSYSGCRNGSLVTSSLSRAERSSDHGSPFTVPGSALCGSRPRARLSSPAPGRSRTNLLPVRPDLSSARRISHRRAFRFRDRRLRDRSPNRVESPAGRAGFVGAARVRMGVRRSKRHDLLIDDRGNEDPHRG